MQVLSSTQTTSLLTHDVLTCTKGSILYILISNRYRVPISENHEALCNWSNNSLICRSGYLFLMITLFKSLQSILIRKLLSFFFTNNTGAPKSERLGLIKPLSDRSSNCFFNYAIYVGTKWYGARGTRYQRLNEYYRTEMGYFIFNISKSQEYFHNHLKSIKIESRQIAIPSFRAMTGTGPRSDTKM